MSALLFAGAQAAGNILGQLISNASQKKRNEREFQRNKEMADYKQKQDIEMWQMQNEYNNPSNQMERLRQAGLNPNMVYGSGKAAGNTSSQLPAYSQVKARYDYDPVIKELPNMLSMYQDYRLKQGQIDNLAEQRRILESESEIRSAEADFRSSILHNKNLSYGARGDIDQMKQKWWYSDKDEAWSQRGMRLQDSQHDYLKEGVRLRTREFNKKAMEMNKIETETALKRKMLKHFEELNYGRLGVGIANALTGGVGKIIGGATRAGARGISGKFKSNRQYMKNDIFKNYKSKSFDY